MLVEAGHITKIASNNRAWLNNLSKFEMDGTEYDLGGETQVSGGYFRDVTNPPTGVPNQVVSINGRRADGTWWLGTAEVLHRAGEYFWNYGATPPAYELYNPFPFDGINTFDLLSGDLILKAKEIGLENTLSYFVAGDRLNIGVTAGTNIHQIFLSHFSNILTVSFTDGTPPKTVELDQLTNKDIVSGVLNGTNLVITLKDGSEVTIDFSAFSGGGGTLPAEVTTAELEAGTEIALRSYSPFKVDAQIAHSAPNYNPFPTVFQIPLNNIGEVIYLPTEEHSGIKQNITVESGSSGTHIGFDPYGLAGHGPFGESTESIEPHIAVIAAGGTILDWRPRFLYGTSLSQLDNVQSVEIRGTLWLMDGPAEVFNGRFLRRIQQGGTAITTTTWALNVKFLDNSWMFRDTLAHHAGLYEWVNGNYSRIQGRLGDRGYSIVLVYLEVTDGSTPDLPSGGETTDGILTTLPPGGWVYSAPTNPTGIIWIAQGFVGQTVSPTWRSRFPVQGSTANGISTDIVYLRSDTTPATPSGGTALNGELTVAPGGGWALDKPTGTEPLWIAFCAYL